MSKGHLKVAPPWRRLQAKMAAFTKLTGDCHANEDSNDPSVSIPQTWKTVGVVLRESCDNQPINLAWLGGFTVHIWLGSKKSRRSYLACFENL